MELQTVSRWIDAYVRAWDSNDPKLIADLFTEDATYAFQPWGEPLVGRDAIVAGWRAEPDEPGSWDAHYKPMLLDGERAIITGLTRYADGRTYSNLFVVDFRDDGRCRAFTEWYMRHPRESAVNT